MRKNTKFSRKTVLTLSLASFLNDLGSDMIYPVWPLFVTSFLKANMPILGLIDGIGNMVVSISQAISGYLSDKLRKRKVFVYSGYFLAFLSRIGYSFSITWQHLILFKIADRLGKLRGAPRDALIADVSTRKNRGKNFGILRAMDNLGAVFGIISCVLLFSILGYRKLFLLAAFPSLVGTLLVILFVREIKPVKKKLKLSIGKLNKNFILFLVATSIFYLGWFSYSFLLIYAKELGFLETSIPLLYLIFTLTSSLMSIPFGKISDRFNRKSILFFSYLLFALMCLGFIYLKNFYGIIFLFFLYGLHNSSRDVIERTFVSELSPINLRGSYLGIFKMIRGICLLPASVIAGLLWQNFGKFIPFYFSSITSLISMFLLFFVKEK